VTDHDGILRLSYLPAATITYEQRGIYVNQVSFSVVLNIRAMRLSEKSATDHSNTSVMKRKSSPNPIKLTLLGPRKRRIAEMTGQEQRIEERRVIML